MFPEPEDCVRFLLNDEVVVINHYDPSMSILNYLRRTVDRFGTKDGCATGDCGACTVVVGECDANGIIYKSINSCISPVSCLQGKQLITIEDLADDEQLHPIQQAMVDFHGSQCGFCTPGVIMSLFALCKQNRQPTQANILQTLTGNLCRCTGYRSIIKAALSVCTIELEDKFDRERNNAVTKLANLHAPSGLKLCSDNNFYFAPSGIDELVDLLLHHPDAQLLAGGTSLLSNAEQNCHIRDKLIFIGGINELKTIEDTQQSIILGAAITVNESLKPIQTEFEDFGKLLFQFGSQQIRNQATLGGNIANASPVGDILPALIVLDASINLRRGSLCRNLSVEEFIIGYKKTTLKTSEFIQSIEIPKAQPGFKLKLYKISKRQDVDRATVLGAFYLHINNGKIISVNIAFGGIAEIPSRACHCEAALLGQPWIMGTILLAMAALEQDFRPISDVRASAVYRLKVAKNLFIKCFAEMQTNPENTQVNDYA